MTGAWTLTSNATSPSVRECGDGPGQRPGRPARHYPTVMLDTPRAFQSRFQDADGPGISLEFLLRTQECGKVPSPGWGLGQGCLPTIPGPAMTPPQATGWGHALHAPGDRWLMSRGGPGETYSTAKGSLGLPRDRPPTWGQARPVPMATHSIKVTVPISPHEAGTPRDLLTGSPAAPRPLPPSGPLAWMWLAGPPLHSPGQMATVITQSGLWGLQEDTEKNETPAALPWKTTAGSRCASGLSNMTMTTTGHLSALHSAPCHQEGLAPTRALEVSAGQARLQEHRRTRLLPVSLWPGPLMGTEDTPRQPDTLNPHPAVTLL